MHSVIENELALKIIYAAKRKISTKELRGKLIDETFKRYFFKSRRPSLKQWFWTDARDNEYNDRVRNLQENIHKILHLEKSEAKKIFLGLLIDLITIRFQDLSILEAAQEEVDDFIKDNFKLLREFVHDKMPRVLLTALPDNEYGRKSNTEIIAIKERILSSITGPGAQRPISYLRTFKICSALESEGLIKREYEKNKRAEFYWIINPEKEKVIKEKLSSSESLNLG